jgi:hypothetical protein
VSSRDRNSTDARAGKRKARRRSQRQPGKRNGQAMTYRTYSNSASENSFQRKPNTGNLFKNVDKKQPQHSDYNGTLDVEGKQYWIDAWIRESKAGTKYLAVTVKLKGAPKQSNGKPFNDDISL